MNLSYILTISLFLIFGISNVIEVYDLLNVNVNGEVSKISGKEGLAYFSDKLDGELFRLKELSSTFIDFLNQQNQIKSSKPQLIVSINGINNDVLNLQPNFQINNGKFLNDFKKLFKNVNYDNYYELTPEIKLITQHHQSLKALDHFKVFKLRMNTIWNKFTAAEDSDNSVSFKLINDKFFINELTQLIHLSDLEFDAHDKIFIDFNSLISILKKTGNSTTFENGSQILYNYLNQLTAKFNVILIKSNNLEINFAKRNQELNDIFQVFDKKSTSNAKHGCFESQENCEIGTSNCGSHGTCTKSSSNCWSCVCSPTFNKTTSRTTNWAGYDCSKQDISTTANLLLWSTIGLIFLFVAGIKLLVSMGNEPLPGVLDTK